MEKRVLIKAGTFATSKLPGEIIQRGQVVDVEPEVADYLDQQVWMDKANNPQNYFVKTNDPRAVRLLGEEAEVEAAPVVKKKRATRKKKTA